MIRPSLVILPPPLPLDRAAMALGVQPLAPARHCRLRRLPGALNHQRGRHRSGQSSPRRFAVAELAPRLLGHDPQPSTGVQPGSQTFQQQAPLHLIGDGRACHIPHQFDPGRGSVDMLTARAAAATGSKLQLAARYGEMSLDLQIVVARHS